MVSLPLLALLEKSLIFAVGLGFGWMGYRLLQSGLYEHAAPLKEASAEKDLLWKQVLPGVTFSLFAGVIVIGGLYQPPVSTLAADRSAPAVEPQTPGLPDVDPLPRQDPFELDPLPLESPEAIPEAGSVLGLPEAGSALLEETGSFSGP